MKKNTKNNVEKEQVTNSENSSNKRHDNKLLKAGIALTLASSILSLGATCYSIFSKDKSATIPEKEIATNVNNSTSVSISQDGYWVINGIKTTIKAEGTNGTDGKTPHIGENGNWFFGETDSGIKAEGENGEDGNNGTNGTNGVSVLNATIIPNDKWNISTYIMFSLSDGSYIMTSPQIQVNNGHYYEAESAEDIKKLVETYGVNKIKITKDFNISNSLLFAKDTEFDLNRKSLTYSSNSPLVVNNNSFVSFTNGNIHFNTQKAILIDGKNSGATFEDTNIFANATIVESLESNTKVKIENSSLTSWNSVAVNYASQSNTVSMFVFKDSNATIELKDSTILTENTLISATNNATQLNILVDDSKIDTTSTILDIDTNTVKPTINIDDETINNSTASNFNSEALTSGTFNFNPSDLGLTAPGFDSFNVNGSWIVSDSFASLVKTINSGSTIKIHNDLDFKTAVYVDKKLTVDLNGHIITVKNDTVGDGVFCSIDGGDLTIQGNGLVNGVGKNNYNMAVWAQGGNITINGGCYTNIGATDSSGDNTHFDLIYASAGGTITINNGTFYAQTPEWILNIKDAHRETSSIIVNGGIFYGFNPANNLAEGENTNFVSDGFVVIEKNGAFMLTESFEDAIADSQVSSITLTKNISLTSDQTIRRNLNINLNSHTITALESAFSVYAGFVNIDNGTINAGFDGFYVDGSESEIVLNLGNNLSVSADEGCCVYIKGQNANLITSANLTSYGIYSTIQGNGQLSNKVASITINGGKITHPTNQAIYAPQTGTLSITGGEIKGTTALYVKSGTVNISGGKFIATGSFADYNYNGNGSCDTGDAIVIDSCGYPGGNPVVTITGGTFEVADNNAHTIAYYSYNGNTATINASGFDVVMHTINA